MKPDLSNSFLAPRDWTSHSPHIYPGYKSTLLRGPKQPLIPIKQALAQLNAPVYGAEQLGPLDNDLTKNAVMNGDPLGERIIVTGRVMDEDGRPVRNTLVEVWQANAAGRYVHKVDQHDAPLDPNFLGAGRCMTDNEGRYRFKTIKPGGRSIFTFRCSATTSPAAW
jgi:protocatechuate 3,4-dioxygenase beta subunit